MAARLCLLAACLSGVCIQSAAGAEPTKIKLDGAVRVVAFSPDGGTLVTASLETPGLKRWDVASGKATLTFGAKGGALFAVLSPASMPGAPTLAAGGLDSVVYLYDVASGKEILQLKGHEKVVTCAAFAPAGTSGTPTLATGSQDGTIRIWDVATGKELSQFKEPEAINALAYSPDGKTLVSVGWFQLVHMWDLQAGTNVRQCVGHRGAVMAVAFAPDGRTFATGGDDRSIRIWEFFSAKEIRQIEDHAEQVNALAYSVDGRTIASASGDRSVRLWDIASGREVQRFAEHQGPVFSLAFSANGKLLASGSSDRLAIIRDVSELLRGVQVEKAELTTKQLETMWKGLANANPRQGYRAIWALNAAPRQTLALFQDKLAPFAATADKQRIAQFLADLNDDKFAVREKATTDLENLGEIVEAVLQKALMGFLPSLEVRRRIERILEKIKAAKGDGPSPEVLRALRAVTILESIASPEAKQLLEKFANGMPEAQLTQDATAALGRLTRRASAP